MSGRPTAEIVADLRDWIDDDCDDASVAADIELLREIIDLLAPIGHPNSCECCHDDDGRFVGWSP